MEPDMAQKIGGEGKHFSVLRARVGGALCGEQKSIDRKQVAKLSMWKLFVLETTYTWLTLYIVSCCFPSV